MTNGYTNEELVETLLALANSISQTQRFGDTADKLNEAARRIAAWDKKEQRERDQMWRDIFYAYDLLNGHRFKKMWRKPEAKRLRNDAEPDIKIGKPLIKEFWIIDEW